MEYLAPILIVGAGLILVVMKLIQDSKKSDADEIQPMDDRWPL